MNILVLGATGMLGSMVYDVLKSSSKFKVVGTARKKKSDFILLDANQNLKDLKSILKGYNFVINCIGITKPYCHDDNVEEVENAININSLFPYKLDKIAKDNGFKVIQIATDCVYCGREGKYKEDAPHDALDVYGKTKSLGEVHSKTFLNIRSSIIGPEKYTKVFLLEWFLKQPAGAILNGFTNHFWNGVTTLQFAELCLFIIEKDKFDSLNKVSSIHNFVPNEVISKYQLLSTFKKVFGNDVTINKQKGGKERIDRTLDTKYNSISSFFPNSNIKIELEKLMPYINKRVINV